MGRKPYERPPYKGYTRPQIVQDMLDRFGHLENGCMHFVPRPYKKRTSKKKSKEPRREQWPPHLRKYDFNGYVDEVLDILIKCSPRPTKVETIMHKLGIIWWKGSGVKGPNQANYTNRELFVLVVDGWNHPNIHKIVTGNLIKYAFRDGEKAP